MEAPALDHLTMLAGLAIMIGVVILAWCIDALAQTMKKREEDEGQGPGTLGP